MRNWPHYQKFIPAITVAVLVAEFLLQSFIPGLVTISIVALLEVIDVDDHQDQFLPSQVGSLQGPAIFQHGQGIPACLFRQLVQAVLLLADVAEKAQEAHNLPLPVDSFFVGKDTASHRCPPSDLPLTIF